MDAQSSCIWRTVNSSVKRTARRSFVSLSHTHIHTRTHARARKEGYRARESFITCRINAQCWEGYFENVIGYRLQVTLLKM